MTTVLMTVHVVAALVLLGPITAAASLFPRYARQAVTEGTAGSAAEVLRLLHRITGGYTVAAVAIPVFGVATALGERVFGQVWLTVAIALTVLAAALIVGVVLPGQRRVLAVLDHPHEVSPLAEGGDLSAVVSAVLTRLAAGTGMFALTWVAVAVLMIAKPGAPPS